MRPFTQHTGLVAADGPGRTSTPTRSSPSSSSSGSSGPASASSCSSTGGSCDDGSPNPEFELNRPAVRRGERAAGAAEFRLRLEPRARPLGAGGLRLPRAHRAELRRHLLQQLLQERHAADPARRGSGRRPVPPRAPRTRATSSRSTWKARTITDDVRPVAVRSRSTTSAATACSNGLDDIGLTLAARRQDRGLRAEPSIAASR